MLIHILANMATNMLMSSTVLGFVPALLRTNIAIILAILYFDKAAAIVKPPSKSMITGVHIAEKTKLAVSLGGSRLFCFLSSGMTPRSTTKKGTSIEVTNNGIACPS